MNAGSWRLCTIIALLLVTVPAYARVWHVERDGGGDFATIQPAVDAAAAGDTIQIGPGRFDEWFFPDGYPSNPTFVHVTKDLSFFRSGTGVTLIGPESVLEFSWFSLAAGFAVFSQSGCQRLVIRDLTVENLMRNGVYFAHGPFEMDRCEIRGCVTTGVNVRASLGGWVRDCYFHDNGNREHSFTCIALLVTQPSVGFVAERCDLEDNFGVSVQVGWAGSTDIAIRHCRINHGHSGIVYADGASGSIVGCTITDQYLRGVLLSRCSSIIMEGNYIEVIQDDPVQVGIDVFSYVTHLVMRNNVVKSNGYVLGFEATYETGEICQNHFLRASDTAWWLSTWTNHQLQEPFIVDLGDNYWGTTDTELLDQWIYDGNDDEDVDLYINYLPLAEELTAIGGESPEADGITLAAEPNPLNPSTTLRYALVEDGAVSMRAYDLRGRLVRSLYSGHQSGGPHSLPGWSRRPGMDLPSGTYLLRLEAGSDLRTLRVSLVR